MQRAHHVDGKVEQKVDTQSSSVDEEKQRATQRSIHLHMQLLNHTLHCGQNCKSENCKKMRGFLEHRETHAALSECTQCRRVTNLLCMHYLAFCQSHAACPLPYCKNRDQMEQRKLEEATKDLTQKNLKKLTKNTDAHEVLRGRKDWHLVARIGRFAAHEVAKKAMRQTKINKIRMQQTEESELLSLFESQLSM